MTFQLQTDKNPFPFPIIFIGMNPIKAGAQSRTKNNIHSIRAKILHPLLEKLGIPLLFSGVLLFNAKTKAVERMRLIGAVGIEIASPKNRS